MRYRETGNVHMDFHLSMASTIDWVSREYGSETLRELFRRTAQRVYREIWEDLKRGDTGPLLEHWRYYFDREGGRYTVTELSDGEFVFEVLECPAARHLRERGLPVPASFTLQDVLLNDAWSEGTPFSISTEILGEGAYRMSVARRGG